MLSVPWIAALLAIFAWWGFTGVILMAVRGADRVGGAAYGWVLLGATPVLAAAVAGVALTLGDGTASGALLAFLAALGIWGWVELAFLVGLITGPVKTPCPPGLAFGPRFRRAIMTLAHHELALVVTLFGLAVASQGAANQTAFWTFALLFAARVSAKLNLFFGVPQINLEFVPRPLAHLKSYFTRGPVTPMCPISVTLLALLTGFLVAQSLISPPGAATMMTLLATLSALALLEHWLMVLPLPDAKLWRWMLPAPHPDTTTER